MLGGVKKVPRLLLITLSLFTIPLNIIQTYQYKEFILHWIDMDKDKYWSVFLKTEDKYRGLVWRTPYDENLYSTLEEVHIGDVSTPKNTESTVYHMLSSAIPDFDKVSAIQVILEGNIDENNDTRVVLAVNRVGQHHTYYWHEIYLIHFQQNNPDLLQEGRYNFEFSPLMDGVEKEIAVGLKTGNQNEYLKNVRIRFLIKN